MQKGSLIVRLCVNAWEKGDDVNFQERNDLSKTHPPKLSFSLSCPPHQTIHLAFAKILQIANVKLHINRLNPDSCKRPRKDHEKSYEQRVKRQRERKNVQQRHRKAERIDRHDAKVGCETR